MSARSHILLFTGFGENLETPALKRVWIYLGVEPGRGGCAKEPLGNSFKSTDLIHVGRERLGIFCKAQYNEGNNLVWKVETKS